MTLRPYLSLARVDSWSKNLIVLVGVFLATTLSGAPLETTPILLTLAAICLASSANYVLNESLDAKSDAYHPIKKKRASVEQQLNKTIVAVEYTLLFAVALLLGGSANQHVLWVLVIYLACGWLYNIPPLRFKDKAHLDVLLESINYPLRVLLGWLCVMPDMLPPSSLMIIAWAAGAFTMSLKRLAEFQLFDDAAMAARYRKSYATYTVNSLAISGFVYAMLTVFGTTVLLIKYKIELILIVPVLIALLAWYFLMGLQRQMFIIYPERLVRSKIFLMLCLAMLGMAITAFQITIPELHALVTPLQFGK